MRQRNTHDQLLLLAERRTPARALAREARTVRRVGAPRREPVDFGIRRRVEVPTLFQVMQRKMKRDWS